MTSAIATSTVLLDFDISQSITAITLASISSAKSANESGMASFPQALSTQEALEPLALLQLYRSAV